jgi:hypothetical protein
MVDAAPDNAERDAVLLAPNVIELLITIFAVDCTSKVLLVEPLIVPSVAPKVLTDSLLLPRLIVLPVPV